MRYTLYIHNTILISLLIMQFCDAQSINGKWVEINMTEASNKIWFKKNGELVLYMSEEKEWFSGTYKIRENDILIEMTIDGATESARGSYAFLEDTLTISNEIEVLKFTRLDFDNPTIIQYMNSDSNAGVNHSLNVKDFEIYHLKTDDINLHFTSIELGKYAKLILPDDQYALVIDVDLFKAGIGAEIIGNGKNGRSELLMQNQKKSSLEIYLKLNTSDCATGFNGINGLQGEDGEPGCTLTINADDINIENLDIYLRGGNGERGENGENGQNGGNGNCYCHAGNGGSNGMGGMGGNGGNGGSFKLRYNTGIGSKKIYVNNYGGFGGDGGSNGLVGKGGKGAYYCRDFKSNNGFDGSINVYVAKNGIDGFKGNIDIKRN